VPCTPAKKAFLSGPLLTQGSPTVAIQTDYNSFEEDEAGHGKNLLPARRVKASCDVGVSGIIRKSDTCVTLA
jgi:hypothetical protein